MISTTIITPTIGTGFLKDAVQSVRCQTHSVKHLIVVDGAEYYDKVLRLIDPHPLQKILVLPENVGGGGWYGHRIYASVPMLVNTPYVAFLDEDNYFDGNHIEVMESAIQTEGVHVVTSRRTVVRQDGTMIGLDNAESIGSNNLGYDLYDTNTYLFKQSIASKFCPAIYGQWGADRMLTDNLQNFTRKHLIKHFGVNYRSPVNLYQHFERICTK